jgi:acetyl-CoA carboxylase carboxyl transferase subunit alpha
VSSQLNSEKIIQRLEEQIRQLRLMAEQHGLDVNDELTRARAKLDALRQDSYSNLTAVERVQLARHPKRPYTLDYIERRLHRLRRAARRPRVPR